MSSLVILLSCSFSSFSIRLLNSLFRSNNSPSCFFSSSTKLSFQASSCASLSDIDARRGARDSFDAAYIRNRRSRIMSSYVGCFSCPVGGLSGLGLVLSCSTSWEKISLGRFDSAPDVDVVSAVVRDFRSVTSRG